MGFDAMMSELIDDRKLRMALGSWMLQNSITECIPIGFTREDYLEAFRMPQVDYVHTQTLLDENGDAVTTLKAVVELRDWQSRSGNGARFVFYKILKTFTDTPDVEPAEIGYIIA